MGLFDMFKKKEGGYDASKEAVASAERVINALPEEEKKRIEDKYAPELPSKELTEMEKAAFKGLKD